LRPLTSVLFDQAAGVDDHAERVVGVAEERLDYGQPLEIVVAGRFAAAATA
jgi:hypothetical protein